MLIRFSLPLQLDPSKATFAGSAKGMFMLNNAYASTKAKEAAKEAATPESKSDKPVPKSLPPLSPPGHEAAERDRRSREANVFVETPEVFEMPLPARKPRNRSCSTPRPDTPLKVLDFHLPTDSTDSMDSADSAGLPPPRPPKCSVSDAEHIPLTVVVSKPPLCPPRVGREAEPRPAAVAPVTITAEAVAAAVASAQQGVGVVPAGKVAAAAATGARKGEVEEEEERDVARDSGLELQLHTDSCGDSLSRGSGASYCAEESTC